jgi:hypothetical protein
MRLTISTLHELAYEHGHNDGLALDDLDSDMIAAAARIDERACLVAPDTDHDLEAIEEMIA